MIFFVSGLTNVFSAYLICHKLSVDLFQVFSTLGDFSESKIISENHKRGSYDSEVIINRVTSLKIKRLAPNTLIRDLSKDFILKWPLIASSGFGV